MNLRYSTIRLVLCAALAANLAFAQGTPDSFQPDARRWLTQEQLDELVATVPPPPAPGSAADQADLTAILTAQRDRTPEIEAECKRDEKFSELLFQSTYGNNLTPENSPTFYQLLKNVLAATGAVNGPAKAKYQRPRPYQGHADVVHAVFAVNGYSYPSGHSMGSFTLATVLGAVFPARQQAFLDRAAQIAQSRVDAGVHYPSDIKEGEVLGKATGAAILASPAFQADLAKVQADLKR
jgi:acid phosphatase (class A)